MADTTKAPRAYVASRFALELDNVVNGWVYTADGGGPTGDVILEKSAQDLIVRKHVGNVSYDDIVLEVGLSMGETFFDWIAKTLKFDFQHHSGAIHYADSDGNILKSLEFYNALISEITLPALDSSSKTQAKMTLKLQPEYTRLRVVGPGQKIQPSAYPINPDKSKLWQLANFRLRIDGLEEGCASVTKIDALTIKQTNSDLDIGEYSESEKVPASVTIPDLSITLPEGSATQFTDWLNKFLIGRDNTEDKEKSATLEFLANDLKTVLMSVTFSHLGIYKMTPVKADTSASTTVRTVNVKMYCEEMAIKFEKEATAL